MKNGVIFNYIEHSTNPTYQAGRSHSHRKATIGFTLLADLAGSKVAKSATMTRSIVTTLNVTGSYELILNKRLDSTLVVANAAIRPSVVPTTINLRLRPITN